MKIMGKLRLIPILMAIMVVLAMVPSQAFAGTTYSFVVLNDGTGSGSIIVSKETIQGGWTRVDEGDRIGSNTRLRIQTTPDKYSDVDYNNVFITTSDFQGTTFYAGDETNDTPLIFVENENNRMREIIYDPSRLSSEYDSWKSADKEISVGFKNITPETNSIEGEKTGEGQLDLYLQEGWKLTPAKRALERDTILVSAFPKSGWTLSGLYLLKKGDALPSAPYEITSDFSIYAFNDELYQVIMPSYNSKVYAVFTAVEYDVSYQNLNGASNSNPVTYTIADTPISLADLVGGPLGYTFEGWYDNPNFSGNAITSIPANSTGNKTFYAKWTLDTYTISYQNLNGASNSNPTTYTYNDTSITLQPPTGLTGYIFEGWYDNADFSGNVIEEIPANSTGNRTFYAKWTPEEYAVSVNASPNNGGKVTGDGTYKYGDSVTIKASANTGYKFKHWLENGEVVSTSASYTFEMTAARSLTAEFETVAPSVKVSGTLVGKTTAKGKTALSIGWIKTEGAAGYDIFFAECNYSGKKIVCKKVKTIKGNKTFTWTKSGLKKGTAYKAYVKAYVMENGKKKYVRTSPMMHAYTGGYTKKYTNAKSVSVNKTKVTLKKGKTFKIKAKVNKLKTNKKLTPKSHAPTLRYLSSNKKVATVSSSGKITAKGNGSCIIYVYAHNGVYKQVKVTVK